MANGRFNGTPSFDHSSEGTGNIASLPGAQDCHIRNFNALVAFVDDGHLGRMIGQDTDLLQSFGQGISILGVPRHVTCTDDDAFLELGGKAYFDTEFVGLVRFAFGNVFNFGDMNGVELFLVFGLLSKNPLRALQKISGLRLVGTGNEVDLALDAAYPGSECAKGFLYPVVLFGMRIAGNLGGKPWGFPVVVLVQV